MSNARATYSRNNNNANGNPSLLKRLKDPQVWVCAIAAFTLIGLSTGMLDASDSQVQAQMLVSSAR